VISNLLSEINQIKQCLKENVISIKTGEETSQDSFQDSPHLQQPKRHSVENDGEILDSRNERIEVKKEKKPQVNSESFDLSEFITNYLSKTYKNVIESSS